MPSVWRIGSSKGLTLPMLAFGSTLESGRWHRTPPDGLPVVYAGASRALCQLEKRVHCNGVQPRNQALLRLDLPDDAALLDVRTLESLPAHWREDEPWTQDAGVRWRASGASLGLWVPSAVEPGESNLVINPDHARFASIVLTVERNPFQFDDRLFHP
jgi:RES domain-containing protein